MGTLTAFGREEGITVAEGGHYDIVILGGGSGGYACALRAAELGKRVALIEKDKVGGTCLHRGCIPTKALLHAAEVADSTREREKFGVRATFEGIEMPAVLSYQQGVVERLWKGLQSTLASQEDRHDRRRGPADLAHLGRGRRRDLHGRPRRAGDRVGAAIAAGARRSTAPGDLVATTRSSSTGCPRRRSSSAAA